MLLSNPSLLILFSFFGKVLGYFPFFSIIYKPVFSAWRKSVLQVLVFFFVFLACNPGLIKNVLFQFERILVDPPTNCPPS